MHAPAAACMRALWRQPSAGSQAASPHSPPMLLPTLAAGVALAGAQAATIPMNDPGILYSPVSGSHRYLSSESVRATHSHHHDAMMP